MRDLLVAGADVNATLAPQGFTALMIASCFGRVKCVRELLKFKADIEAKSGDGRTALMYAADYGHAGIIRELLEGGADVNMRDYKGGTALMIASLPDVNSKAINDGLLVSTIAPACLPRKQEIKCSCMRELLKAGADVNARDKIGFTALMKASMKPSCITDHDDDSSQSCCMVQELLKAGADHRTTNLLKETAEQVARRDGKYSCAILLQNHAIEQLLDTVQSTGVSNAFESVSAAIEQDPAQEAREREVVQSAKITATLLGTSERFLSNLADGKIPQNEIKEHRQRTSARMRDQEASLDAKRQAVEDENRRLEEAILVFVHLTVERDSDSKTWHDWLAQSGIDEKWLLEHVKDYLSEFQRISLMESGSDRTQEMQHVGRYLQSLLVDLQSLRGR